MITDLRVDLRLKLYSSLSSLRRCLGWSYEVLMLSRYGAWWLESGRYSIPGPSYTAPCTIGHRTYLSTLKTGSADTRNDFQVEVEVIDRHI